MASDAQVYSNAAGNLFGAIDGTNKLFETGVLFRMVTVQRNGVTMTLGVDYIFGIGSQFINFVDAQTPQPGDIITLTGYPLA